MDVELGALLTDRIIKVWAVGETLSGPKVIAATAVAFLAFSEYRALFFHPLAHHCELSSNENEGARWGGRRRLDHSWD